MRHGELSRTYALIKWQTAVKTFERGNVNIWKVNCKNYWQLDTRTAIDTAFSRNEYIQIKWSDVHIVR